MKHLPYLLLTSLIVLMVACKSRPVTPMVNTPVDPKTMDNMWKTIDSLEKKGLITSALEEVRSLRQMALASNASGHLVKAVVHENRYLLQLEEDSAIKALARAEEDIVRFPEPAKSVLHSLTAQWYTQYLESRLWELRDRTEYAGPAGPDIRTWGIRHFVDRITSHYTASVAWSGLTGADVQDYLLILTDEKGTDSLRPTLYDILMHRALDYFGNQQTYLTSPVYGYVLTDPGAFSPARSFIGHPFPAEDTLAKTWIALKWYQQLLAFRLSDSDHEAAKVDADLRRLRFVYDQSTIEGKDRLYMAALKQLSDDYKDNPESALVDFQRAELLIQLAAQWPADKTSPHRSGYREAFELCNKAIQRFPDSYGAQLCKTLLHQIQQKTVTATLESVNLPQEDLLAKLEYRNVDALHLRVVRLPESPRRWRGEQWDGEEVLRRLLAITPVKSWQQNLDNGEDFQPHSTEIAITGLPLGHYALVVSDAADFNPGRSTTGTVMFTVSELGYWLLDDREQLTSLAVVHRRTGQPLPGVKAEFISYDYNASRRQQEEVKLGEKLTDQQGWAGLPMELNKSISIRLTKGADELFLDDAHYTWRAGGKPSGQSATMFFTDRAIYRPGQKVFVKGYALEFTPDRIPSIVPNRNVDVVLYDANGQEVSKQSFRTNAYGTFAGHFNLPAAGLTGQMSLASGFGGSRHFFNVEEYKRPRFEVTFDTLKEVARLNEDVTIIGVAKDYAGSAVSGAEVLYRVERVSYIPWWWGFRKGIWPGAEDRQVLASGKSVTALDGQIPVTFNAKPKAGGDPDLMYRFEITLYVTDITGESHEATKSVSLNQQGYEVQIQLSEKMPLAGLTSIPITSVNGDGAEVTVKGEVEVTTLKGPAENKRDRLWPAPDMPSISEEEYVKKFSHYFLPGREQMDTWMTAGSAGKQSFTIPGKGVADLSGLIRTPGYYKLAWTWKDASGKALSISQYIMVYASGQLLPGQHVLEVDFTDEPYEPGQVVAIDALTGISSGMKAIRLIEHRVASSVRSWQEIPYLQDRSIRIAESDRGGVYVHHLAVYNNRFFKDQQYIRVPWSNKDLTVSLKTWRDKMEPGDEETWTITVQGNKKEKVSAELLLSMYDASLDAFVPHQWQMSLYPMTSPRTLIRDTRPEPVPYWGLTYHWTETHHDVPWRQYRDINTYGYYPEGGYYGGPYRGRRYKGEMDVVAMQATEGMPAPSAGKALEDGSQEANEQVSPSSPSGPITPPAAPSLRSALDETVFFFPQMNTDAEGNLTFSFKMKEGLTRWKFQALGHTKDLAFGLTQQEVVTQKQLMVFPNPPRFFREGDTISFQIKVSNLTGQDQAGRATLKLLDAFTDEDVSASWKLFSAEKPVQIEPFGSSPVTWSLQIPDGWTRPVKYQVSAMSGTLTDGEEALVPVVTNRVLITETLPLPVKAGENRTFMFKSMLEHRRATTVDHQFVVEMTTTPAWYAVQALPYLMEYPHECAEQIFSRLYANSLATHIANKYPAIRNVYDGWRAAGDDALMSNLEKNQDLKSAMLEETPWVRDAMGETRQKRDIANLFDTNRLRYETRQSMDRLRQMQLSNGGFSWFPGGRDNWYITQYIVEGFGHLQKMEVKLPDGDGQDILQKAVPYIDARMIEWYNELKRQEAAGKLKMSDHQIGSIQVHYLYARSFFPDIVHPAKLDEIHNYMREQIEKYWLSHGLYEQGLMALAIHRQWPQANIPSEILASLRERTIVHEELGRYWKMTSGYFWHEAPVELQSLMIELYQDMKVPQAEIDELRVWLLKQKQTTQWKTTKATASAIYALLIHPDTWLQSVGIVQVKLGQTEVIGQSTAVEAGTGYVRRSWNGTDIQPEWSGIAVSNPNNHIAWGSAYWQYWEDLDQVKTAVENNPLKVTRSLLIARESDRGVQTGLANGRQLHVGDKLIVRLTIETDRRMEYVHLKDLRASGFEPMDVLSGYRWSGGLGYYQSTRDLATHFFIDDLPRGKYILEYPVTVAQAGAYSEGLATLQCMYAPEFGSHSEGSRVAATVK